MKNLPALVMLVVLSACSSAPVDVNYYLLRGDVPTGSRQLEPFPHYGLGTVELASYINQRGLLLQTADNEIRPARYHMWAEPLSESVPVFLAQEVSLASGRDLLPLPPNGDPALVSVNVRIDQFHGTSAGGAILVAHWWLSDAGKLESGFRFVQELMLEADGYANLVRAQEKLLAMLATEIARELGPRDQSPTAPEGQ